MELVLTGDTVSGTEFQALGLVNKVFPASETVPAAIALAERIAANSAPVTKLAKQAVLTGESSRSLVRDSFSTNSAD
jgi:enoyl-CoA hydratase